MPKGKRVYGTALHLKIRRPATKKTDHPVSHPNAKAPMRLSKHGR